MQDKHIDDRLWKILGDNFEAEPAGYFNFEEAVPQIKALITTEQLAILERLKRESRELVKFNKTEPLNVGEIQNVELIRAVPIEAIQQQIDKIGGRNA